jgi:hypothetical protein
MARPRVPLGASPVAIQTDPLPGMQKDYERIFGRQMADIASNAMSATQFNL